MKKILTIALVVGLVCGVAGGMTGSSPGQVRDDGWPWRVSIAWSVAGFVVAVLVPWLWRGLLNRTREVSKAVRGKE